MSKKNAEYWAERFKDLEKAQNEMAAKTVKSINASYDRAIHQVQKEIDAWYQRFAKNNQITYAEARKRLNSKELKELQWDVKEYIKYGKDNELNQQWIKELENASAKVHISRFQALELNIRQAVEKVTADQENKTAAVLSDVYETGYYHTAYEIAKGLQIGSDIGRLDERAINNILHKPWAPDGKNFSDRIWENKNKLLNTIHQELSQNIMTGADPQKAIDAISKKMNTSKYNAGRLVMTEEAYFNSLSQGDMFKELDVEKYEIVATLDSHTSEICQDMDGKVFPMSEYESGVTVPPFHVYCRSTTAPWFPENYGEVGERAARNSDDDKTYHVPADMSYDDWYKKFVENDDKSDLKTEPDDGTIKGGEEVIKSPQNAFLEELQAATKIDDINKLATQYFKNKEGCKVRYVNLDGVEINAAKHIVEKLDDLTDRFESTCVEVTTSRALDRSIAGQTQQSETTYFECLKAGNAEPLESTIYLNKKLLHSKKAIETDWKQNEISKHCAVSKESLADVSTFIHEFGHSILPGKCSELLLDEGISNPTFMACRRMWRQYMSKISDLKKEAQDIMFQYAGTEDGLAKGMKASKSKWDELDALVVSKYSKDAPGEFIAECFTDVECGRDVKDISKKVYEALMRGYGKK